MSQSQAKLINNNLPTFENNEFKNEDVKSNNNNEKSQDIYIKIDNLSSNSDEKLSELNTSTENNQNEKDEFFKNYLSFLDTSSNEPIEKNINSNNIINNNNYDAYSNIRNLEMKKENFNYENFTMDNMNEIKYKQLYKMMILNNIYCQQIAYINNFIHNYNYNMINNAQNIPNQNTNKPHKVNKSNTSNKTKKFIDKKYLINLMDIKTNKEQRTTIRMMNIPSYFRPLDLAKKIDEKLGISPQKENRVYDFIYIPFKESKKNERLINAGYAFINFVHPKHILKFYSFFHGKHLKLKTSGKVCIITFASRQGINIKHNNFGQSDNDKYMFFSDTKNHFQLLTD
jgi:hypothetical protein